MSRGGSEVDQEGLAVELEVGAELPYKGVGRGLDGTFAEEETLHRNQVRQLRQTVNGAWENRGSSGRTQSQNVPHPLASVTSRDREHPAIPQSSQYS